MPEEQLHKLEEIFRAVFECSEDADVRGFSRGEAEGWDSLGHVSLVSALESEFAVEIDLADSVEITSFGAAAEILEELLAE